MSARRLLMVGILALFCLLPLAGCNSSSGDDAGDSGAASSNTTNAE